MKETHDELPGNRIGIWRCLRDVLCDRPRIHIGGPALPRLVEPGKKELPEIFIVVTGIETIESLGLVRIWCGSENRPFLRANVIHLELGRTVLQQTRRYDVENRTRLDVGFDIRSGTVVGPQQVAPDTHNGDRARSVLRPVALLVISEVHGAGRGSGDCCADVGIALRIVDLCLKHASQLANIAVDLPKQQTDLGSSGVGICHDIFLACRLEALPDLQRCVA